MELSVLAMIGGVGVVVGALASGLVGIGFPIISVPLITLGYGLETAVVVTTIPTLAIDIINLWSNRSERGSTSAKKFMGFALAGAATGALVRGHMNEALLTIVLAGVVATYLATEAFPSIDLRRQVKKPGIEVSAGAAAGFLQSTIGVSGPIVGIYFVNRTVTRGAFIFGAALVFTITGMVRATGLTATGAFTAPRFMAGVVIALIGLLLRWCGAYVGTRLEPHAFRTWVTAILAISLLFLIVKVA